MKYILLILLFSGCVPAIAQDYPFDSSQIEKIAETFVIKGYQDTLLKNDSQIIALQRSIIRHYKHDLHGCRNVLDSTSFELNTCTQISVNTILNCKKDLKKNAFVERVKTYALVVITTAAVLGWTFAVLK